MSEGLWIATAVAAVLVVIAALILGSVRYRRRRISLIFSSLSSGPSASDRSGSYTASSGITFSQTALPVQPADRIDTGELPAVGDDATVPRDSPRHTISDVLLPESELITSPDEPEEIGRAHV